MASGGKSVRRCCSWPGCPPRWRFWPSFRGGLGGLTRSLDGGLEEFEEFFFAFASWASNAEIRSNSGAVALATAASIIGVNLFSCEDFSRHASLITELFQSSNISF